MIFKGPESSDAYRLRISQQHEWFAWYPVRINRTNGFAWMQKVWRIHISNGRGGYWLHRLVRWDNK